MHEDEIAKTLRDIGVDYTHRNDSLIAENAVEGERIKALLQVRSLVWKISHTVLISITTWQQKKKALKQSRTSRPTTKSQSTSTARKAKSKSPDPHWPPKRKHHKPAQTPQEK